MLSRVNVVVLAHAAIVMIQFHSMSCTAAVLFNSPVVSAICFDISSGCHLLVCSFVLAFLVAPDLRKQRYARAKNCTPHIFFELRPCLEATQFEKTLFFIFYLRDTSFLVL